MHSTCITWCIVFAACLLLPVALGAKMLDEDALKKRVSDTMSRPPQGSPSPSGMTAERLLGLGSGYTLKEMAREPTTSGTEKSSTSNSTMICLSLEV
jgi:hypothetical protein